jgi:parallel beta-helix repeat protein
VGLGNVDNTSDASKPVSTATSSALALKANKTDLFDLVHNVMALGAVGDGVTDDTAAFQMALNLSATDGLPVWAPNRTFILRQLNLPSGSSIDASGPGSVFRRKAGTNNYLFKNLDTTNGNANISLRNFSVDGNYLNQTAAPFHWLNFENVSVYVIEGVRVSNSGNTRLKNASNGSIGRNYFDASNPNYDTVAIFLEAGSSYNRIWDNEVRHYCNAVNIYGTAVDTTGNTVVGNTFHDDGYFDGYLPTTRYGDAILIGGSKTFGNTITGNTITNYGEDGIRITDSSYGNAVSGNTIVKTGRHGISLNESVKDCTVTGNIIRGSGQNVAGTGGNGIFVDITTTDNSFAANKVFGAATDGIQVTSGSVRNTLTGNVVHGAGRYGIYVLSHGNTLTGNDVFGNAVTQNGIFILNARNNKIIGGSAASCTVNGVRIENNKTPVDTRSTLVLGVRAYDDLTPRTQGVGINVVATNGFAPQFTTIIGCDVLNNLNAGISDAGEASQIQMNSGHNPSSLFDLGVVTTAVTVNRTNGMLQTLTLSGNAILTFTNGRQAGDLLWLKLIQDATGSRVPSTSANVRPARGGLLFSSSASAVDVYGFQWDGSTWNEVSRALASAGIDARSAVVANVASPIVGTDAANKVYVDGSIASLVASSPATLDTLNELATALGNDPNFATTTLSAIGLRALDNAVVHLAGAETVPGAKTFSSAITAMAGVSLLSGGFSMSINPTTLTANQTITMPNVSGTVVLATNQQTLTNKTLTNAVLTGSLSTGFITTSTTLTLSASHQVVEVTAAVTITLPTAASITGRRYDIINSSAGTVTIATTSSQVVGNTGSSTTDTVVSGNTNSYVSNGAAWRKI